MSEAALQPVAAEMASKGEATSHRPAGLDPNLPGCFSRLEQETGVVEHELQFF